MDAHAAAGTFTALVPVTYVDVAPATSAASTYSLRVIVTSATNVNSAATTYTNSLNAIVFPN